MLEKGRLSRGHPPPGAGLLGFMLHGGASPANPLASGAGRHIEGPSLAVGLRGGGSFLYWNPNVPEGQDMDPEDITRNA